MIKKYLYIFQLWFISERWTFQNSVFPIYSLSPAPAFPSLDPWPISFTFISFSSPCCAFCYLVLTTFFQCFPSRMAFWVIMASETFTVYWITTPNVPLIFSGHETALSSTSTIPICNHKSITKKWKINKYFCERA